MSEPQSDALTTSPQPPKYQVKIKKCLETESNCRHMELQSIALPTELSRQKWRSRRESNPRSPAWQAGVITATPRDLTLILNVLFQMVTRTGFEPVLPPWKGGVLTTWPTGQKMAPQAGLEPATLWLTVRCYYQLSYCG